MSDDELSRLHREVCEHPEDPARWVALARALVRLDQYLKELEAELLPAFRAAWAAEPEVREMGRIMSSLTALGPEHDFHAGCSDWWGVCPHRAGHPPDMYDRRTGLPLLTIRYQGKQPLLLIPELDLEIDGKRYRVADGYLDRRFYRAVMMEAPGPGDENGLPLLRCRQLDVMEFSLMSGALVPPSPEPGDNPLPLPELFGRHLSHGLRPEDREPLPPPRPRPEDIVVPEQRLKGAMPPSSRFSLGDLIEDFLDLFRRDD